jgi:hypothetical protein
LYHHRKLILMKQISRFYPSRHSALRLVMSSERNAQQSSKPASFRAGELFLTALFPILCAGVGSAETISGVVNTEQESALRLSATFLLPLVAVFSLLTLAAMSVLKRGKNVVHLGQATMSGGRATPNHRECRSEGRSGDRVNSPPRATFNGSYPDLELTSGSSRFVARNWPSKLRDWSQAVLKTKVVREDSAIAVLEQVPLREVETFLREMDYLGFNLYAVEMSTRQQRKRKRGACVGYNSGCRTYRLRGAHTDGTIRFQIQ